MNVLERISYNRKFIIAILSPVILIPIALLPNDDAPSGYQSKKWECAYVIALMSVYWMTEALPVGVVSLIPVVLFPLFGVLDASTVAHSYMTETGMMFTGALTISLAMEYSRLHRRLALRLISATGGGPARILFSIMFTTMFLSMWMFDTATTAMMVPVVVGVLGVLDTAKLQLQQPLSMPPVDPMETGNMRFSSELPHKAEDYGTFRRLVDTAETKQLTQKKIFLISIAYSSVVGGTGVLTGSLNNLVYQKLITQQVDVTQGGKYVEINFTTWMAANVPAMVTNLLVVYLYFVFVYFDPPNCLKLGRNRKSAKELERESARQQANAILIKNQYKELGSMSFHESAVSMVFALVILLWFTRDPGFMPGWAEFLSEAAAPGDSTAAMLGVLLLFLIPRDLSIFRGGLPTKNPGFLLDWRYVQERLPWGIILLLGSGFAISDGAESSGLTEWVKDQLIILETLPPWVALLVVMTVVSVATEFMTGLAMINVFVPVLADLSQSMSLHPYYLTLPVSIFSSFGFMLPAASPSTAITFATGELSVLDLVKTGAFLKISSIFVYFAYNVTYTSWLFGYPSFVYENTTLGI